MTISIFVQAAMFAVLGVAVGVLHFRGLRETTRLYLGGGPKARPIALHALRVIVTAAVFVGIAQRGAVALLAAFAGFVAARVIAVARARREP
jgi:F1F0 ATPase subunit 2